MYGEITNNTAGLGISSKSCLQMDDSKGFCCKDGVELSTLFSESYIQSTFLLTSWSRVAKLINCSNYVHGHTIKKLHQIWNQMHANHIRIITNFLFNGLVIYHNYECF